jgi:hypothetical protein
MWILLTIVSIWLLAGISVLVVLLSAGSMISRRKSSESRDRVIRESSRPEGLDPEQS